jgi:hypothetical protein
VLDVVKDAFRAASRWPLRGHPGQHLRAMAVN